MPLTGTDQHISHVSTVNLPVRDQEAALRFYVDLLGFEVVTDAHYGEDLRWVEVAPPGSETRLSLSEPSDEHSGFPAPGSLDTVVSFSTPDVDAAVETLAARGVEFEPILRMGAPVPPMVHFRDLDGNRFLLVEAHD